MKKLIWRVVCCMMLCTAQAALADETRVATWISLKNDWVVPQNGQQYMKYDYTFQWNIGKIGAGMEIVSKPKFDYLSAQPYATYTVAKGIDLLIGLSTDSNGEDYYQVGVWYDGSFDRFGLCLDLREYTATSAKAKDYTDNWMRIYYRLTDRFHAGLDFIYDRVWEDKSDDFTLGIMAKYKASDVIALIVRPSRDWYIPHDGPRSHKDFIRLDVQLNF